MKRITYWPQLFLGITFNYGLVLAWISIANEISSVALVFYFGAIFWTLGYDTIYGYQDIKDDEIIGIKSTSIKFKEYPKKFLMIAYFIFFTSLFSVGLLMEFNLFYFIFLLIPLYHLLIIQIFNFKKDDEKNCLKIFKSNNLLGLIILINIFVGKLY